MLNKAKSALGGDRIKKGFTLIELLVVIFIIAIMSAIILVNLSKSRMKSRDNRRKTDLATIQQAVEMKYSDSQTNRRFIVASEGVSEDCTNVNAIDLGGYLSPIPNDPSGSGEKYCYKSSPENSQQGQHYIIVSILENSEDNDRKTITSKLQDSWWGEIGNSAWAINNIGPDEGKWNYFVSSD